MAEQENKETSEVKNEVKTDENEVQSNKTVDEEKVDKKVETNSAAVSNLRLLENIEVRLTVEVGNTEIKIKDLLRLNEGSVIELDRLAGDALDILANGTKIAKGEVVMVGEKFGIRFTEVATPEELMQNL
ncbi:MAG: flagellar motor switch protein FliN [Alphaproteobacteria bacterium]